MAPTTTKQWTVQGQSGFDSLKHHDEAPIANLDDHDVVVNFKSVSLNYRALPIANKRQRRSRLRWRSVVEGTGARVSRFKKGDKVMTLFNQGHIAGPMTPAVRGTGGMIDGALTQYGTFDENGLVAMPATLDFQQASTLSCAAVTAWNALYGLGSRALKPGHVVLTQGTGGVSIFAVQFALAGGATVIATTSSESKAEKLKKLGAHHVINYKDNPNWGETAKNLTPGKQGVHHVIEVGGPNTLAQSLKAVRIDGVIDLIGFLAGTGGQEPGFLGVLTSTCMVRGVQVGSRLQFEEMNRAIDGNGIKPVVDEKVFKFGEVKEAYQYMWEQKHFGKLTITVD
ncbi:MAG: hypothetical protein M1830_001737 [Pleopsidium flavum]|nr:MAG: hypothetical protein M1830_001737 [Pleopsidium flavum]